MDNLYKLILIGKPFLDSSTGVYRIRCYFQPWLVAQNKSASEEILIYAMHSTLAGKLICGTIWTDSKNPSTTKYNLPAYYHTFKTSSGMLYACRLKHLLITEALSPSKFWMIHDDTWVICVNSGNKKIIIPYFELLRVFFYKASQRLTNFIFSQNPISSLCSPLVYPHRDNLLTARYCIATTKCTLIEARLLGCLLFDPQLIYIFNVAQAYWRVAASPNNNTLFNKANTIAIGDFGITSFNASGYNFSHNNEDYFWVHNLEVIQYNYKFDNLLYYPLNEIKSNNKEQLLATDKFLLECPDILQFTHKSTASFGMRRCFPETAKELDSCRVSNLNTNRQWSDTISKTGLLPLVVRRQKWAVLAPRQSDYFFLSEDILRNALQKSSEFTDVKALGTHEFRKFILTFKSQNYSIKYLTLNNPKQVFGKQLSVFPVNGYPPLPVTIYQNQIQYFPLVEIVLTNAVLYIAQPFPESNPALVLLFIKQNLIRPTSSELNMILSDVIAVHNEDDLHAFHKRIYHTQVSGKSSNTALLAIPVPSSVITVKFCIDLINHVVDRFRKRLQFVLAVSLRYPQGVTLEQRKKVIALSSNICKAPDSLWQGRISNMWRAMSTHRA